MTAPELPLDPLEYPGSWDAMPVDARRYVTALLLARMLDLHEGPAGLFQFLYAGTMRLVVGQPAARIPFTTNGRAMYPFLLEDTAAWAAAGSPFPIPLHLQPRPST